MSTILCIDTASDRFALALERDGAVTSHEEAARQDHSRLLLPAIAALLGDAAPEALLVVTGPGAYAGIRVGLATAEGLALARDVPVFGIGTLEAAALAYRDASGGGPVTIVHPAGRGEFAAQDFSDAAASGDLRLETPETLSGTLAGEGAGALGGTEISSLERAVAALNDRAPRIRAGELNAGAEPFYLREPNITVSRRLRTAAS